MLVHDPLEPLRSIFPELFRRTGNPRVRGSILLRVTAFVAERDWSRFHSAKNLAMAEDAGRVALAFAARALRADVIYPNEAA